jgi:hypothetical protein
MVRAFTLAAIGAGLKLLAPETARGGVGRIEAMNST